MSHRSPSVPVRRLLICTAAALALLALDTGCGNGGREKARDQIRQSGHAFTADDFVKAAGDGDMPLVEAYLRGGVDRNAADSHGATALMAAAVNGKTDVLKALLDENARPDLQNKEGETALILAASLDQAAAVRTLIEGNSDVRVRDHKNRTALLRAVNGGFEPVVDVLLTTSRDQLTRDGQIDRAMAVAAVLGNVKMVGVLLDRGGNANGIIENKQTALMFAASFGKQDVVELLLSRGADPRLVNSDGANASVLALQHGYPALAKLIDTRTPGGGATAPVTTASAAPSAAPGGSPGGSPTGSPGASPPPPGKDAASVAMERAWLKQNGVEPAALLNKDTGQDDDKDGFTNDEELAAGTDPNDPNSHPPYYTKLRLKRIDGETFPVVFEEAEAKGSKITLTVHEKGGAATGTPGSNVAGRRVELVPGSRVPGQPYRVASVRLKSIFEKDTGRKIDVSELTLVNTDTGHRTVLVRGMQSNSADATAVLHFLLDDSELPVKQGQQFTIPRDPATHFEVIDIRPTQVILKVVGTAQTVTVEKE